MKRSRESERLEMDAPIPLPDSERTRGVVALLGLDVHAARRQRVVKPLSLDPPSPGELMLIEGASGAGKSTLLRRLRRRAARRGAIIDLNRLRLADRAVVDCFDPEMPLQNVLRTLSRFGLSDCWTCLRRPAQLSTGQRWRLRLALAASRVDATGATIVCDEFATQLDRITAIIVAAALRRLLDRQPRSFCAIVATSHDDLWRALRPDITLRCDFGVIQREGRP